LSTTKKIDRGTTKIFLSPFLPFFKQFSLEKLQFFGNSKLHLASGEDKE
jgi:hypothetical protein